MVVVAEALIESPFQGSLTCCASLPGATHQAAAESHLRRSAVPYGGGD